ncbi:hypothetical protein ES703_120623 [subsurface metagenome]
MAYTGKGEGAATSVGGSTLSDLKDICTYHGWSDTSTEGYAALTNFINRTLQILSRLGPWPEYHKRDGTISILAADEDYTLSEKNIQQLGNIVRANRRHHYHLRASQGAIDSSNTKSQWPLV